MAASEKRKALNESLDAMIAYDRQAMESETMGRISALHRQQIKIVDAVLKAHDARKINQILRWLRALD